MRKPVMVAIAIFLAIFMGGTSLVALLVDYYWMEQLGYDQVFLGIFSSKLVLGLLAGLIAFVFLWANFRFAVRQVGEPIRYLPPELAVTPLANLLSRQLVGKVVLALSGVIALMMGLGQAEGWEDWMRFQHGVPFGGDDGHFGLDPSFYVFTLPFLARLQSFLGSLAFTAMLGSGIVYMFKFQAERVQNEDGVIQLSQFSSQARTHFGALVALMLVVLAFGLWLDRYEMMHQAGGLFSGPGYAEIHGELPALAIKAAMAILTAGLAFFALARERLKMLIGVGVAFAAVWLGGNVYTTMLHRFVVAPNELEKERPYLEAHIKATNIAFGLDKVVERPLTEDTELNYQDILNNRPTINNVRLWDHEPLLDTFAQIQEIRTYYEFVSVDNDRYMIDGELRQTMLSPRELNPATLPSRTWVNERLTYTHGYGLTMGPVNRVNEQGLPVLFVQDLPPKTVIPELKITSPEIYYGEVVDNYIFVKTKQEEFDYPEGDNNITSIYNGKGGLPLDSWFQRLLLSIYLRDMKLILADDFTNETRIMLHRNIFDRLRKVVPFIYMDRDPYMVIHEGRLVWIFDMYTISNRYPWAEQVGNGGNYMRNPVKAVIDAKDGTLDLYLMDAAEPIAATYAAMFPGLFRDSASMPEGIRAHLRHPAGFFDIQTNMYATYHMTNVNTFYNKEDQWSVPVVGKERMEPYYTVMKLPGEKREEFILMRPFTPRRKDNLAAWMVARSDGEYYGQLVVYTFPKQKLIYGPKQMVARINQDTEVSQQITLWDQSGSNVIRGTLLVIPIESSLIYIQPLYLRAEDGRIPELKRVIVGYQNEIAMGENLEDALTQIFGQGAAGLRDRRPSQTMAGQSAATQGVGQQSTQTQAPSGDAKQRAMQHYRAMQEAGRKGDWVRFGQELDSLGRALEEIR